MGLKDKNTLFVEINLGWPHDSNYKGKTQDVAYQGDAKSANFNYCTAPPVDFKMSKSLIRALERGQKNGKPLLAKFTLKQKIHGFLGFGAPEKILGIASVPLTDL